MDNIFSSYTTSIKSTKGHFHKPMKLADFCNGIRNGEWKTQVEAIRAGAPKNILPYVVISAIMADGKRSNKDAVEHSGLLQIDIDAKENADKTAAQIKATIKDDKHLFAVFVSPSGNGVKAVASIPKSIDGHKKAYLVFEAYFMATYGIKIDSACKDIARPFYVCYDPEIIVNEKPVPLSLRPQSPPAIEINKKTPTIILPSPNMANDQSTETDIEKKLRHIEKLCEMVEQSSIDITSGYANYIKIGFAIADGLGETGRAYFHRLCRFYPDYKADETDLQFTKCQTPGGAKWPSLLEIAKDHGLILYPKTPIIPGSTNINNGAVDGGKMATSSKRISDITPIELLENTLLEMYSFQRNTMTGKIEGCKSGEDVWGEIKPQNLWRALQHKRINGVSVNKIKDLLESDFVEDFDPITDYYNSLTPYDKNKEPDYINNAVSMLILKDETNDRERLNNHYKKAIVRTVACALPTKINNENFNKHAIVLVSPLHSIGKTNHIKWLCPPELQSLYVDKISTQNRDAEYAMRNNLFINLDEMASIGDSNLNIIKTLMSQSSVNVRGMNSEKNLTGPRRCTFWGTTNDTNILKDRTGNSRFICFELLSCSKEKEYWKETSPHYINIKNIHRQALTLFRDGFPCQLTPKELEENEKANNQFLETIIEEELIAQYLSPTPKNIGEHLTTTEIMNYLGIIVPSVARNLNIKRIGQSLQNMRFILDSKRRNGGLPLKGYWLQKNYIDSKI